MLINAINVWSSLIDIEEYTKTTEKSKKKKN